MVLITLFSVAITHSCFTWVAVTVAAFLRYLIPPQTTLSETRLKLTFSVAQRSGFTQSEIIFFGITFSFGPSAMLQTPGPVKTSNAGRDGSVFGISVRDGGAVRCARRTPVPRVDRATASAPATTSPTRASAP